ncbi:phage minor capsid protein [Clostridium cadaveris]|uniref:phage minor capsid protein n=1 Tax=Clostridium cadaveris TaxID=1529 RepID=UPI0015B58544|nr:phage minor capsid protein [Clostridium cadaveris]
MDKKNKPTRIGDILKSVTKKYVQDEVKKEREKSYDVRKIFEQMELDLISSMNKAFYFHQREEEKEGFQWEQWQLTKLREIEKYRKRNKDIVDSYSRPIQKAIDRELRGNYSKGQNRVSRLIEKLKQLLRFDKEASIEFPKDIEKKQSIREYISEILNRPIKPPQETNFFGVNEKKLKALMQSVNSDLNKAEYAVLRKMDDVYRQTIFKTHMYLQNGAKTLNQAIDMSTKDFLDKGINSIQYKNGANVNIASYAEMALRTANHRAMLLGEGSKRDEYGIHLVVVSAHANTCPKCEPWQGKILIDDVFSHPGKEYIEKYRDKYKMVSEAIAKGLLHPNCRHALITYFEGITRLPVVSDGKEAIKVYDAEQRQRAYERDIRKWKRIEAGSVDEENKIKAANNVRKLQNKLKKHIKNNPKLRINNNRTEVKEFNPKEHREYLKRYDERVKIKRDGATRAEEFSKYWGEASLKETINKFVPNATASGVTAKGKVIYSTKGTKVQIVYDTKGNYFRIEDLSLKGKRRYLDIEGNNASNKTENGKQKGRSKEEYEALTHFKNSDKED